MANDPKIMGWDDVLENDGQEFIVLPEGDYTYTVTRFERGEALISANNNKVPVVIKASREEQELITTDRAELEAILRQRQKEQQEGGGSNASD